MSVGFASVAVTLDGLGGAEARLDHRWLEGPAGSFDASVRSTIAGAASLDDAALHLLRLLSGGYAVWQDGKLIFAKVLVERIRGLRIVIHTREHGPPHFHVEAPGINAAFAIEDCAHLMGEIGGRERELIKYWHVGARVQLIRTWNDTRPSNCPVGPIEA